MTPEKIAEASAAMQSARYWAAMQEYWEAKRAERRRRRRPHYDRDGAIERMMINGKALGDDAWRLTEQTRERENDYDTTD